jgi:phytoene dehydrogenase-like protein
MYNVLAALLLAGKRVLVLEQHYTAGGFTHAFARGPYAWNVGVHYIGMYIGVAYKRLMHKSVHITL